MSYKITSDCNSCGACEPECPNTAISQGDDTYVINADACTECVGFHAAPQCAAVCPVDACVTDEAVKEDEAALIAKAKKLHPNKDFSGAVPSHFRK
ncbi:MAG: YfhL family 4Fe-4S dicluster ferredoxin [Oligoflexia bacterium]|nr:YfhL family 4Fe-4S dicluster ferredoxin [Oligoflexia bacterium]